MLIILLRKTKHYCIQPFYEKVTVSREELILSLTYCLNTLLSSSNDSYMCGFIKYTS